MEVKIGLAAYLGFSLIFYGLSKIRSRDVSLGVVLTLPITSLILSSLLIKFLEKSKGMQGYTENYFVFMTTATFLGYIFLYSEYRNAGIYVSKPIKRHWTYYVKHKPYTTLYEGTSMPSWGRRMPSRYEILEWKEKAKHFAPATSQWVVFAAALLMWMLELGIFLSMYTGRLDFLTINFSEIKVLGVLKFIGGAVLVFKVALLILNRAAFFIVEILEAVIESILNILLEDHEWIKLLSFTVVLNALSILSVFIMIKFF